MKKILIPIFVILSSIMFISGVKAASGTYSVTSSKSTVVVGNTVTVYVKLSASVPISGWQFTIKYDTSILTLTSGDSYVVDTNSKDGIYSTSYTYTFKAKASGTAKVYLSGVEVQDWTTSVISMSGSSASITCMTQAELEATYSSNNNLSSLGIDGYTLSPSFSSDTTNYTVELKPETESINVTATKEDSTATLNGVGTVNVSEGTNTIKVEVVAQNGNIKTYTITATVKELDPINVTVNGTDYTVVRSKKALTFSNSLFTEITTNINGTDVPAYYNEITNTTIVALKTSDGTIKYFIVKDNNYVLFNELKLGNVDLMVLDATDIPSGYTKSNSTINDIEYPVYNYSETSRFHLIYSTKLENNNTGFYVYDDYENTLERYDEGRISELNSKIKTYKEVAIILVGVGIGLAILLIISLVTSTKYPNQKKSKQKTKSSNEELNDDVVPEDEAKEELQKKISEIEDSLSKTHVMYDLDKDIKSNSRKK